MTKESKQALEKIGGFSFFVSIPVLALLDLVNIRSVFSLITWEASWNWLKFGIAAVIGAGLAFFAARGELQVFIHEIKHSIISNLAGNRAKSLRVRGRSGHFEYEYTDETAHNNALIALAPYFFPLFTIVAAPAAALIFRGQPLPWLIIAGTAYGADLYLGLREVHPHQTDMLEIRGGYAVALLYVALINIFILTVMLAWAAFPHSGLLEIFFGWWEITARLLGLSRA